ncbi:flagellar basal-body rod protein FlgF [Nitrosomonas sp.]|uniref:flagellar basal-body rod protein FlgF n=1 Tax=Nitrosomonas sp. TaxID=42353 RepID=UPI001D2B6FDC|nr:flagellar basal-body rod protein FlgF [Nitrosomonas sp.]MCB1947545.1 flagellar basal-body rod protein FlgF [Nitrosomonas sp.]MCP5244210.1 flagellar basal-body rod protein FlgF [Burkholderiales bacterium]MDR4515262.1 flagellar basal-body rod protein FlgF [Nitrosomonas sp.]
MDRLIYTAMTGAAHTLNQKATVSHNLANASTTGYRAENNAFRAVPVYGDGLPTRAFVVDSTTGADFTPGPIQQTDRSLDVAVRGSGWITVELPGGKEAYTRHGSLQISPNGILQTHNGFNVKGDTGIITVPQDNRVTIAKDGTVSVVPITPLPNTVAIAGRIKLVDPPENQLIKGPDGLFRMKDETVPLADANVTLVDGALEGSNVNLVHEMVSMIALARQFDMHIKILENAERNAQQASEIMVVRT